MPGRGLSVVYLGFVRLISFSFTGSTFHSFIHSFILSDFMIDFMIDIMMSALASMMGTVIDCVLLGIWLIGHCLWWWSSHELCVLNLITTNGVGHNRKWLASVEHLDSCDCYDGLWLLMRPAPCDCQSCIVDGRRAAVGTAAIELRQPSPRTNNRNPDAASYTAMRRIHATGQKTYGAASASYTGHSNWDFVWGLSIFCLLIWTILVTYATCTSPYTP